MNRKKYRKNKNPHSKHHIGATQPSDQPLERPTSLAKKLDSLTTGKSNVPSDSKTAESVAQLNPTQPKPESQTPENSSNLAWQAPEQSPTKSTQSYLLALKSQPTALPQQQTQVRPSQKVKESGHSPFGTKRSYLNIVKKAKAWGITIPIIEDNISPLIVAALNRQRILTPELNINATTQEILNVIAGLIALNARSAPANHSEDAMQGNEGGMAVIFTYDQQQEYMTFLASSQPGGPHSEERMIEAFWDKVKKITNLANTNSDKQQLNNALRNFDNIQLTMFSERSGCGKNKPNHNCENKVRKLFEDINTKSTGLTSFIYNQEFKQASNTLAQQGQFNQVKSRRKAQKNNDTHRRGFNTNEAIQDITAALDELNNQPAQKLRNNAHEYGFETHDVNKDGNCLFAAIYAQLPQELQENYHDAFGLRQAIVQHMRQNIDDYQRFIEVDSTKYLANMAEPGTWGGQLEIRAASWLLNCTIATIRSDATNLTIIRQAQSARTLYLGFEDPGHYQYLSRDSRNITNPRKDLDQIIAQHQFDQMPARESQPKALPTPSHTTLASTFWANRPSQVNQALPAKTPTLQPQQLLSSNSHTYFTPNAKTGGSSQPAATSKNIRTGNTPSNRGCP